MVGEVDVEDVVVDGAVIPIKWTLISCFVSSSPLCACSVLILWSVCRLSLLCFVVFSFPVALFLARVCVLSTPLCLVFS